MANTYAKEVTSDNMSGKRFQVDRLANNPIITPDLDDSLGGNINGPSLVRVPRWVSHPLGAYYLYFAHHSGKFIRMAYADRLDGPWRIYKPGVLRLEQSWCRGHIASPDVHIDEENRRFLMFYHGVPLQPGKVPQATKLALSADGLHFEAMPETLGRAYWRSFRWRDMYYGITMSGRLYRSRRWTGPYEEGPNLFRDLGVRQRHMAVKLDGDRLYLFFSIKEDAPEHIVVTSIALTDNWLDWKADSYESVLKPETVYEGADLPLLPSKSGAVHTRVRQLRDPGIFEEDGRTYLLYAIAGESGIAIARIKLPD